MTRYEDIICRNKSDEFGTQQPILPLLDNGLFTHFTTYLRTEQLLMYVVIAGHNTPRELEPHTSRPREKESLHRWSRGATLSADVFC